MDQIWFTIIMAFFAAVGLTYSTIMVICYNRLADRHEILWQVGKRLEAELADARKREAKIVAMLRHPSNGNRNENIFDKFAKISSRPYDWQKDN